MKKNLNKKLLLEIAKKYETPCYVYSKEIIEENFNKYKEAFAQNKHSICYSVKANSNISVLSLLNNLGASFDVVSVGELKRVLVAGGDASSVIFSGVGKKVEEIAFALDCRIKAFDIESIQELETIISVAQEIGEIASISVRFNPNVDAKTHPYISTGLKDNKFGLTEEQAFETYKIAKESNWIEISGINMHIGSQLTDISAFEDALAKQAQFILRLETELNISLKHINTGGGLGINYEGENTISMQNWVDAITKAHKTSPNIELVIEPGRSIVGNAGVLLTQIINTKPQGDINFAICDAAMNDYMRVALYQAYNHIENISLEQKEKLEQNKKYTIVGPICESADFFAKGRELSLAKNDILAICDTGAYGFVMSSNYNSREKLAEILIDGNEFKLIRKRETFENMIELELFEE